MPVVRWVAWYCYSRCSDACARRQQKMRLRSYGCVLRRLANLTSLAVLATVPRSAHPPFLSSFSLPRFALLPLLSPAARTHSTPLPPSSPPILRLLQKPGERTICMWFIVKNEKPVLPRLALSAAGIIDTFYACDTGSTDGTPQVVKDEFGKHGIKGTVVHHDWENFGKCVSAAVCVRAWAVAVWLHACASRGTEALSSLAWRSTILARSLHEWGYCLPSHW